MQKRLSEIIKSIPYGSQTFGDVTEHLYIENVMVRHLIEHGIDIPPCRVGDIVYHVYNFLNETLSEKLVVVSTNFDEKGLCQIYGRAKNGSIFSFTRNYNLDEICFTLEEVSRRMI